MSEVTDWEPEMITAIDWEAQYERQLRINEILGSENMLLRTQLAEKQDCIDEIDRSYKLQSENFKMHREHHYNSEQSWKDSKKASEQEFRILKADIITSLRAINLCLLASITTEKQCLTHRSRNFMMRHVNQIISNEVDRFGDRRLTSYEDDF